MFMCVCMHRGMLRNMSTCIMKLRGYVSLNGNIIVRILWGLASAG